MVDFCAKPDFLRKMLSLSVNLFFTARIEDQDSDFENDEWMIQEESGEGIVTYPLDPVRFWRAPDSLNENLDVCGGRCLGIQCNISRAASRHCAVHNRVD